MKSDSPLGLDISTAFQSVMVPAMKTLGSECEFEDEEDEDFAEVDDDFVTDKPE